MTAVLLAAALALLVAAAAAIPLLLHKVFDEFDVRYDRRARRRAFGTYARVEPMPPFNPLPYRDLGP